MKGATYNFLLIYNVSIDIFNQATRINKKNPVGGFHKSYGNKCNYILRERIIHSSNQRDDLSESFIG